MDDVVGRAWYELGARDEQLDRDLKEAEADVAASGKKAAGGYGAAWKSETEGIRANLGRVKTALAAIGIGIGLATVTSFLSDSVLAASDLNEEVSKTEVVFGAASDTVKSFGEQASSSIGQSERQALAAAGGFGNMFRTIGLAEDAAASMSIRMVTLASDMASFSNQDPSDMLERLRSGLSGEAEPLRQFGVLLSEARVKQEAYASGIAAVGDELTEQQKVQARYNLILKDTTLQHGDFARTSDGLANTQRALTAQWEDLQAELGEKVLPLMVEAAKWVRDSLIPALSELLELVDGNSEAWEGFARIMDTVTLQQGKVQDVMRLTGQSYMDAREIIKDWNQETGEGADTLIDLIEKHGSLEAALGSVDAALVRSTAEHDVHAARADAAAFRVEAAYGREGAAAGDLSKKTEEEMAAIAAAAAEAHEKAVDEISQMFDDLRELFTGRKDFKDAVQEFHDILNNPWTATQRRARIEAELASKEVRQGLRSEDPAIRTATIDFVNGLVAEYETLAPGALAAGELVNPKLQDGLNRNLAQTLKVAEGIAIATGNELDFQAWAERAGLDGLLSFNSGMNQKKQAARDTAHDIAKATADELRFNAYAGGASSAQTFIAGLIGTLTSWDTATRLQHAMQLAKTQGGFGASMPKVGPFTAESLHRGTRSIAEFWGRDLSTELQRQRISMAGLAAGPGMTPAAAVASLAGVGGPALFDDRGRSASAAGGDPDGRELHYHYHLEVNGRRSDVETAKDAIDQLQRMRALER